MEMMAAAQAVAGGCPVAAFQKLIGGKYKQFIGADAHFAGNIFDPAWRAGLQVETADPPLVSGRANIAPNLHRHAGDIGNTFQFGIAFRLADHGFPAHAAIFQGNRNHMSTGQRHDHHSDQSDDDDY